MKLIVENLSVNRGGRQVLTNLSFTVGAGEALVVNGTNGSGKTTLLRTLAGFLSPVSGEIEVSGVDSETVLLSELSHYVGHLNAIKSSQTVLETLTFFAGYFNATAPPTEHEARIDRALEALGLSALASVPCGYLSAGQRRRLGLARLLSAPRTVWLLDEPTTSLDRESSDAVGQIIKDHVKNAGLVIAATHFNLGLDDAQVLHLGAEAVPA